MVPDGIFFVVHCLKEWRGLHKRLDQSKPICKIKSTNTNRLKNSLCSVGGVGFILISTDLTLRSTLLNFMRKYSSPAIVAEDSRAWRTGHHGKAGRDDSPHQLSCHHPKQ